MVSLYSGNLNDFKAATNKLFELDLVVICDDLYEASGHIKGIRVSIEDRTGNPIDSRTFFHHDEDVLYNLCTAWMNNVYDQLKDWK